MNVSSLLAMSGSHSRNPLIKLVQGDRRRSFFWLLFRYTLFYPKICVQRRLLSDPTYQHLGENWGFVGESV